MKRQFKFAVLLMIAFILGREIFLAFKRNIFSEEGLTTAFYSHSISSYSYLNSTTNVYDDNLNISAYTPRLIINTSKFSYHKIHAIQTSTSQQPKVGEYHSPDKMKFKSITYLDKKPNVHIVKTSQEFFLDRIEAFCNKITKLRKSMLSYRGLKPWNDVQSPENLKVLWGRDDYFLEKLVEEKNLTFVLLPWKKSNQKNANTIVTDYYQWTASDRLCEWIRTPGFTKARWDAVYNRSCEENLEVSRNPKSLEPMYFYGKPINKQHYWPNNGLQYPTYFYSMYPIIPLYLTIVQDGIVNRIGDVISGRLKIVPYTCSHDSIPTIPREYRETKIFSEVFVVTQFWAEGYFHRMVEVMPRLAPYLSFLRDNPSIKIHALEDAGVMREMVELLGLSPERLITGVVRAKIVYLPQGTACGFPHVQGFQLLAHHFRTYLAERGNATSSSTSLAGKKLVLIGRSGTRRFLQAGELESRLRLFSENNGLRFHLFSDRNVPSLVETMSIFASAAVVVGPHGAGLSNVIFSDPGTLVVEGVCNPPHVNMCYQFVSHTLGHRYHAVPSMSGCERHIDVKPELFLDVLEGYFSSGIATNA